MDVKLKEEIFNTDNKEFLDRYFGSLVNRFTYSNMSNSKATVILNDNMKAFKYLLGKLSINEGMSKELIKTVANMVNSSNPWTSRLILNFNLLRQGLSPVIITSELNEAYYKCIKYADVDSLARLFREQSLKENEFIDILYMDYCKEKEEHEDNIHKIK